MKEIRSSEKRMMNLQADPDWWKTLFDEIYLITDARSVCDDEITRREVDVIWEFLSMRPEHRILDLCGGHGRHSLELCSRGMRYCTVLDYSRHLVDNARACAAKLGYEMECVQADARATGLPDESFDHVIIMGNSLGYLTDVAADGQILTEAYRLLRLGGWLLVDVVDGNAARALFNPNAWHEIGPDTVVCRQREIQGDRVFAREMVLSKGTGLIRDRTYSIKLYNPETIMALIESAGFKGVTVCADFSSHSLKGDYGFMNRRMVSTGQKL